MIIRTFHGYCSPSKISDFPRNDITVNQTTGDVDGEGFGTGLLSFLFEIMFQRSIIGVFGSTYYYCNHKSNVLRLRDRKYFPLYLWRVRRMANNVSSKNYLKTILAGKATNGTFSTGHIEALYTKIRKLS
jgi:hypothetical protein